MNSELDIKVVSDDGVEREGHGANGEIFFLKVNRNQSEAEYRKLIENQSFYYEGLFKEYKTPYPGILSNTKGWPAELTGKAHLSDDRNDFFVWAYVNKRRVVGECLQKLNHYYFLKYIIRCPPESLTYEVEVFLPFEHYDSIGDFRISCQAPTIWFSLTHF